MDITIHIVSHKQALIWARFICIDIFLAFKVSLEKQLQVQQDSSLPEWTLLFQCLHLFALRPNCGWPVLYPWETLLSGASDHYAYNEHAQIYKVSPSPKKTSAAQEKDWGLMYFLSIWLCFSVCGSLRSAQAWWGFNLNKCCSTTGLDFSLVCFF